jgi:hypothetical protein
MKRLAPVVLALLLFAGCKLFYDNYDFVGTWIGYGEWTDPATPYNFYTINDTVTFDLNGTFTIDQIFRAYDDAGLLIFDAFQRGAGTYTVTGDSSGTLSMTFDDASHGNGLTDDAMPFTFSEDRHQVTIEPTTIEFPLYFNRVD